MLPLLLLCSTAAVGSLDPDSLPPLSEELIRYVNEQSGARWKAANSSRFRTVEDINSSLRTLFEPDDVKRGFRPTVHHEVGDKELPESFDSRTKWPHCAALVGKVRDQANCGAGWAFSTTGAMSDRACITSRGKVNAELSAIHLVSCCWDCGNGCEIGSAGPAWDYWVLYGVVTGSSKEEGKGCKPYPFSKCTHFGQGTRPPCPKEMATPTECLHSCQKGYPTSYDFDKHYGSSSYNLPSEEKQIRKEILTRGPVTAFLTVYADFVNYKSGVYHHVSGGQVGGHSVKIIGWGVEGKTPYWLVVNSWNEQWGENGFFRIRRGTNECAIEQNVKGGLAKI